MSYLEQLKLENTHPEALPKLPEPPFDSFDSRGGRRFPEKKAPVAVVDLATPGGPRSVKVSGNTAPTGDRITPAAIYQGEPSPAVVDLADRLLTHLANLDRPATEAEILTALGGDEVYCRNILYRLAVDGIVEALPGRQFGIPEYPPRPADLPESCPLLTSGGPVPGGCPFDAKMLRRMIQEGALPLPGGRCPLRRRCIL